MGLYKVSDGVMNEVDFVRNINGNKFKDINFNIQLFLRDMYGDIPNDSIVKCYKNDELQKYDIFIDIDCCIKRISIKMGSKNSVHTEPIREFVHFLIENNMPREMVIDFLKYHYADGSTNGSGRIRLTSLEYKINHQDEIDKINKFLNQEDFLIKAIDRFVVKGTNSKESIDAIIYGTINDFLWIKTKDIYNILLKYIDDYYTGIHFSNLFYQPLDRCINRNPRYESRRHISQIKWYSLFDDILENMNNNSIFNI